MDGGSIPPISTLPTITGQLDTGEPAVVQSGLEIPTHMPKDRDEALKLVDSVRDVTLLPQVAYRPNDDQRELKAKFWLDFKQNPLVDTADVSPALVEELTGKPIDHWLKLPGFWDWFKSSTTDTTKRYLEVAAEKAAEMAIMMLDPATPLNDNARVQLIKYVLEFSGRSPPQRRDVKWLDREIQDLDAKQLDDLIAKHMRGKALPKE